MAKGAKSASNLTLRGGTHNPMAPSLSFLQQLTPFFAGAGEPLFDLELRRHGFYPAGGGEVLVKITPPDHVITGLSAINLSKRGELIEAYAECLHAGLPRGVAERELAVVQKALNFSDDQCRNRALRANEGPGNALLATLKYEHIVEVFASYGNKGVSAEQVAQNLLKEVKAYQAHTAPVGPHLADQLMIPMALAAVQGRKSQYVATELTEHTRTNAQVIEKFLPVVFDMQERDGGILVMV
jgi:RNA 3'-terminal phosphate cyclase (ATP)